MKQTIERLGHRGDGVTEDGIFVPRALPGEVVEGELQSGRMLSPRILGPSAKRVRAPCPHYRNCGGCALQHASDDFVENWKLQVVRSALSAQGLEAVFRPIHVSPPGARRRATLAGRRLKRGVLVGFHARASDVLVAVPDCQILAPEIVATLPALEGITAEAASRRTELAFAVTASDSGPDVAVYGGPALDGPLRASLATLAGQYGLARLSWEGEIVVQRAAPILRFGRATVTPPPGAFLQATADGEAALLAAMREAVGEAGRVVDLFSGCGTFALPMSENADVHAVEGDAAMLAAADLGWRKATGLKRLTCETRDLFRRPLMADELARFDAIVIDPPRAGAEAQVAQIARAGVPVIGFVSCNPVTFARDVKTLAGAGYGLKWVQVVDQFRWSAHVELAAKLVRRHTARV